MRRKRIAVDLHHVERGSGRPVLAVHGWTPDHRLMLHSVDPVFDGRDGYRRIYPDLPGMGRSPAPASITGSDDMLAALRDFVDATIGDEPFLLIGESYGGYLSRALANERPGQVRGLALICPVAVVEPVDRARPAAEVRRPDPAVLAAADPRVAAEFAEVAVVQSAETMRRFRTEILTGLDCADDAALERIRRNWTLSHVPESGPPYPHPALVLAGRQDGTVGYADQFALLPHYPHASFAVLDVAGHNLQIEQPALLRALLGEWLDRVASEPPVPPADPPR